jgi:dipeptidyl aminopeptidase/acylaminoacyl peptidase
VQPIRSAAREAAMSRRFLIALALPAVVPVAPAAAQTPDYSRAERLLSWNASSLISGDEVSPRWMTGGNRFWYRNKTSNGFEFILVDPVRNTRAPLFDNYRLAAAMSMANDTAYNPDKLPFSSFDFQRGETAIGFRVGKRQFDCDIVRYACELTDTTYTRTPYALSPDSAWEVFAGDNDLWLRQRGSGDSVRITTDGEKYFAYGVQAASFMRDAKARPRPGVAWSPDSRKLLVTREDERGVELMHYISYTPTRPKHYEKPYALPGDSVIPVPSVHVLDLTATIAAMPASEDGDSASAGAGHAEPPLPVNHRVELAPEPFRLSLSSSALDSTWASGSDKAYVTTYTRGAKQLILYEIDAATGAHRILAADSSKTNVIGQEYIEPKSWYVTRDGKNVIWWSERDGWAHLWLYDGNDHVVNQITSGAWPAGALHRVDEAKRQIWFIGRGRDAKRNPYHGLLYRINFDGTGLTLLTPEDADHDVSFAPSGQFFVDTYSRIETPPVTVLRSAADGRIVRTLETADVSRLSENGWRPAEVFTAKGRDGITDIYGLIYWPPDLDPAKKYPVIENIYPGPFVGSVGSWSFKGHGENFALAQLGFIVVQVDHIGTRFRSKAFHDNYYGNMADNGIPDHVVALKQLAARYPAFDLDRVGIYGHSGGGFASTDAILRYPEFYRVAVSGAGNHDQMTYGHYWGEVYQGLMTRDSVKGTNSYDSQANRLVAGNLAGHLLLMHGDMDDNVHPGMTLRLVNELIRLNKDFDLIIAPDRGHGLNEPYFIRRRWDYFVRWLMGAEPPRQYQIVRPGN